MFGRSPPPDIQKPNETPSAPTPASGFFPAGGKPGPQPTAEPLPRTTPPAGQSRGGPVSVIGQDLHIAGDKIIIVCQSRLQVDGQIRGDLSGREIVIGETGNVAGSVSAETVEVRGRVEGAIRGMSVSLLHTSRVNGDILHKSLAISEGAQFDGRVRRAKDDSELQPNLDTTVKPAT
ncbi:MAG: polymer-forming cytoskeletal protein [Hyphomicrobiaceae bacterium]|nr:polymer-forming cytoskeletal protein [Hyphomicrobiaceae bacterium]